MVIRLLRHSVLAVAAGGAFYLLSGRFGPWLALAIWIGIISIGCGVAAILLRTAPVGRICWKNRVAGYLLPWGYAIGRGKLAGIVITSWMVWFVIAIGVLGIANPRKPASGVGDGFHRPILRAILILGWLVDGGAALYLLGTMARYFDFQARRLATFGIPVGILGMLMVGGGVLYHGGYPGWAVLVAAGPPCVVGIGYGLFVAALFTFGRNRRWN